MYYHILITSPCCCPAKPPEVIYYTCLSVLQVFFQRKRGTGQNKILLSGVVFAAYFGRCKSRLSGTGESGVKKWFFVTEGETWSYMLMGVMVLFSERWRTVAFNSDIFSIKKLSGLSTVKYVSIRLSLNNWCLAERSFLIIS